MLGFTSTFNSPAYAGYLPHLAVRVPRKLRFRGTLGRPAAWEALLRLISRGLRSIAQTLRGLRPLQGKPLLLPPSSYWRARLLQGFISARGIGSISPVLKLWGLTAGGGYKTWHECRTARCLQGGRYLTNRQSGRV